MQVRVSKNSLGKVRIDYGKGSSNTTVLLIEKGELKAMNVGAIPKEALKKWIEKNL